MTSPSKRKGNTYERELVQRLREAGFEACRAWGSDGRALGEAAEVDVVADGMRVQCKRRKQLAAWLGLGAGVDWVSMRADKGEPVAVLREADLIRLVRAAGGW